MKTNRPQALQRGEPLPRQVRQEVPVFPGPCTVGGLHTLQHPPDLREAGIAMEIHHLATPSEPAGDDFVALSLCVLFLPASDRIGLFVSKQLNRSLIEGRLVPLETRDKGGPSLSDPMKVLSAGEPSIHGDTLQQAKMTVGVEHGLEELQERVGFASICGDHHLIEDGLSGGADQTGPHGPQDVGPALPPRPLRLARWMLDHRVGGHRLAVDGGEMEVQLGMERVLLGAPGLAIERSEHDPQGLGGQKPDDALQRRIRGRSPDPKGPTDAEILGEVFEISQGWRAHAEPYDHELEQGGQLVAPTFSSSWIVDVLPSSRG